MVTTTRKQREALKQAYFIARGTAGVPASYLAFRRLVQPTFGMDNAVVVRWCGMWLCIEADGYTHS